MSSMSFDPVAHIYDATRGYPETVAHQLVRAMDARVEQVAGTQQGRYIEVGVGTGRIALPFATLGRAITGVDISEAMMARLYTKAREAGWQEEYQAWGTLPDEERAQTVPVRRFVYASTTNTVTDQPLSLVQSSSPVLRLVNADIKALPFHDHVFDAAIAVHIFHLVDGWEQALAEVVRVVRPGGVLLQCRDGNVTGSEPEMNSIWRKMVLELGGDMQRPGARERDVTAWFAQRGMPTEEEAVLSWRQEYVPRRTIEAIAARSWSGSWSIPAKIFDASIERLRAWAHEYYHGDLETPRTRDRSLIIVTTHITALQS
jgi:ubiquinone/menaquinone biosynthesis C-methylase UbiE